MISNEKKILLFPVASHFLFHFYEIAFPALAIPLTLSLNMSLKDVLELGFPMYLMFGLCALPWGFFADHFSNRLALMIGFFGCAAGSFLTALSSTPAGILWSLAVVGLFSCICHPAGMGLISHTAKNRGAALGFFSVAGTIGLIVGPFLAGLMNWLAGWKVAYAVMGIVSLLWGVALIFIKIDETPLVQENAVGSGGANNNAFPLGTVILFFWIVTLGGLVYRINIVALPAYLEFKAGFLAAALHDLLNIPTVAATTTMAAAALTSVIYIAGIFGQIYGGKIADRYELRRLYIVFNAAILPLALLMAFLSGAVSRCRSGSLRILRPGDPAHREQPHRHLHAPSLAKHRLRPCGDPHLRRGGARRLPRRLGLDPLVAGNGLPLLERPAGAHRREHRLAVHRNARARAAQQAIALSKGVSDRGMDREGGLRSLGPRASPASRRSPGWSWNRCTS